MEWRYVCMDGIPIAVTAGYARKEGPLNEFASGVLYFGNWDEPASCFSRIVRSSQGLRSDAAERFRKRSAFSSPM